MNLAVADLLVGISELIGLSTMKFNKMTAIPGKENKARSFFFFFFFLTNISTFCIKHIGVFPALISLERVYAVLRPIRYRAANTIVYIYGLVFIWLLELCIAGLFSLPMYYKKVEGRYVTLSIHICLFIALLVICTSYFCTSYLYKLNGSNPATSWSYIPLAYLKNVAGRFLF